VEHQPLRTAESVGQCGDVVEFGHHVGDDAAAVAELDGDGAAGQVDVDEGAGTGSSPCAVRTRPAPTAISPAVSVATPRLSRAAQAPTTSAIESRAPTSWKCTCSVGMPSLSGDGREPPRGDRGFHPHGQHRPEQGDAQIQQSDPAAPCAAACCTSTIDVEKVVYPPSTPTPRNGRSSG
jgi:hypothetical protein